MLKVQMMDQQQQSQSQQPTQIINNDSNRDSLGAIVKPQMDSPSPKRMSSSGSIISKTPTSSPLHHPHPVPQRQMTTGSIKSASQGSSPAG